MNAWRFAIALALAACGARSPLEVTNADAGADATPALPSIHGKYVVHYFPDSGEVIAPKDLSRATIEAYSPNEVFFGKGLADGTFIVSGVHTAMFTLRIDDQVVVDVRDGVELSDYVAGRADVDRSVTQGPFSMKLRVDGMIPLPAGGIPPAGFFHLFASNAGCELHSLAQGWTPTPPMGATSVSGALASFSNDPAAPCRIDAAKGDHATLVQTVNAPSGAPQGWRIATLDLPGWSGPNRSPTDITGTFAEIPRTHAFKVDVRPGSFSDSLFVAGATQKRIQVALFERPPVSAHAGPAQALAAYPLGDDPPLADGPFSLMYADPFPSWTKVVALTALELVPIAIPGMSATTAPFRMQRTIDFTSATTGPLAVALSPPQAPRVGGAAPFAAAAGVSTTPRIEWSPPKYRPTGTIRYVVAIQEVCADGCPAPGGVTIWTTATSVVVPAGLLMPGKVYTASVTAEWTGGTIDFAAHPLDGDVIERAQSPTGGFAP